MSESAGEFLRWLDIIPGRRWLVLGDQAAGLAALIPAYLPSAIELQDDCYVESLPFPDGSFDVAVCGLNGALPVGLAAEMRRVIWPAGTVAVCVRQTAGDVDGLFRDAGLHAIQSRALAGASVALKGTR